MPLLECSHLVLGYPGRLLTDDLSFSLEERQCLCILGENGSGKSTLVRTLLHLQPPIKGEIIIGDGLKANEIGYLPQQTVVQKDFPAAVSEIVLSGFQSQMGFRPFYNTREKETARENMERMGISSLASRCYRDLSGGQQQRVRLARALCATRKVLLLDEPVSGLDPKVTLDMYELIQELNQEGITIIMISHDIAASVRYASHILHVGREIFFGTTEEYRESSIGKFFLQQQEGGADDVG